MGRVLCSTEAWEVSLVLVLCQTLVGDAFPLFLSRCATCVKGTKEKKIHNLGKENGPLSATKTTPPPIHLICVLQERQARVLTLCKRVYR